MRSWLVVAFVFILVEGFAQRVGLVLSGGAAKGLAHVGVLKALEENEIPIDYVVGTSMGGIIGGCYAAGMSPDQIEAMVTSDDFLRWVNGKPEKGYNYYYHIDEDDPGFITLNLSLDSGRAVQFNSSLANDVSLNFALTEKMATASAISKNNFDSLFVPLRVVAAEIFTQQQVILSKGSLSAALRATQTVPFFYTPIRVDGKYLFDGGVYNNFPVDVMQQNFSPEVIIGSNVSSKVFMEYPYSQDDKLITNSLLFLLLDKSDPTQIPKEGVYIQPNLEGYNSFDFAKVRALIDSGYNQTIRQLDEIKQKIAGRRTCETVATMRNTFNDKSLPLLFSELSFDGYNSHQVKYIKRIFDITPGTKPPLTLNNIKRGYYKLVTEKYFNNIYPTIWFDTVTNEYKFHLVERPQKNFQVDFGGVIATRNVSNIFLGVNLYRFDDILTHMYVGFQTGSFYKSLIAKARFDLPYGNEFYIQPEAVFNNYDYLETDDVFKQVSPTVLRRFDRRLSVQIGKRLGSQFKVTMQADAIRNEDRFSNKADLLSTDTLDQMKLQGFRYSIGLSTSTLNRKQYASAGGAYSISARMYNIKENFIAGNTGIGLTDTTKNHTWWGIHASAEHYYSKGWFKPGYLLKAVLSNQPYFSNFKGTIINTPGFFPLQDSHSLLLENYRSPNYLAGGARVVIEMINNLDLRLEGYVFKPIDYLIQSGNETIVDNELTKVFIAGTVGLVYHSPVGPVSLSANYYDDDKSEFGVMLHVGFLLYNKHSFED
ncbi:MAG: patatin-like phospholipase family protein [Flammeovirgaceae bacterium]|nr:patatin-like phospholipase family protein [Flammeovirgaceae bacterium]